MILARLVNCALAPTQQYRSTLPVRVLPTYSYIAWCSHALKRFYHSNDVHVGKITWKQVVSCSKCGTSLHRPSLVRERARRED